MVWIDRYVLLDLGLVDVLQDRQPMSNTCDAHFLELVMFQGNQRLTNYFIFCFKDQSKSRQYRCFAPDLRKLRNIA